MKHRRLNPYLTAGLVFNTFFLISNQFLDHFDFLKGCLAGGAIGLMLVGAYYDRRGHLPFYKHKAALINKLLKR